MASRPGEGREGVRPAAMSATCPHVLASGPHAAERAVASVRARLSATLRGVDVRGADVIAAVSLDPAVRPPGFRAAVYVTRPARACGAAVVGRSWAVVVSVPQARAANLQPAIVYAARTSEGWRPWYVVFPGASTGRPVP